MIKRIYDAKHVFPFFTKFGDFCLKNTKFGEKWKKLFSNINSFYRGILSFYLNFNANIIAYIFFYFLYTFEIWKRNFSRLSVSFKIDKITVEENYIFPLFQIFFFSSSEKFKFGLQALVQKC
jgi:hypothetical protein